METRRQLVMQVAQRLFLEKGFVQTSIQDIISGANISKGTFYNYFTSKNECLIAILKHAQKEAFERRKQLLLRKSKNDRTIFAKQIVIRMQVNREQNLLPLFGFVFHSKDQELREFAKTYHLYEVAWLSERFIDVYGESLYPYAVDCAVFVLGLSQQYNLMWSFYIEEEVDTDELILFILRKMDAIVENFLKEEESFIHQQLFNEIEALWKSDTEEDYLIVKMKELLADDLLADKVGTQYLHFLLDEIKMDEPRVHLIQSILQSLEERYMKTNVEETIKELSKIITKIYL